MLSTVIRRNNGSAKRFCTISKILNDGLQSSPITVKGWIRHLRKHKQHVFMVITDGLSADTIQVVVENSRLLPAMKLGAAIRVTGNLKPSLGRGQKYDFVPETMDVVGANDTAHYPLGGKEKCEEGDVRQFLHLRPKLMSFSALLRLRNAAKTWFHNYLQSRNFINIDTPILTQNDCEGAGEAFYVEPADKVKFGDATISEGGPDGVEREVKRYFFSRPVYTTVSAQMHLEATACAMKRVYAFNPAFRAESCLSRHHLAEFYMLELEMAFIDQLEPLLEMAESMLRECSTALINQCSPDYTHCAKFHNPGHMKLVEKILSHSGRFPRISYDEALEIIEKGAAAAACTKPRRGAFTKEQENYLVKHCGNLPVFVLNYSAAAKPFYMARCKDYPDKAACFDLLAPLTGEIIGGGLRESDYDALERRLTKMGTGNMAKMAWYLELRKYGYPGTGGFGLGFERYLQWLLGANSIKDCIPFPRWYNHCYL